MIEKTERTALMRAIATILKEQLSTRDKLIAELERRLSNVEAKVVAQQVNARRLQ